MSIAHSIAKYRNERRRRGATPADASLMETGLASGHGFQRVLEASLSRRLSI